MMTLCSPSPTAALFGKLPRELDFVRANHSSAESIVLDRWLQTALQRLAARNRSWPAGELAFTFGIDAEHSVVGVVADSRDRARRRFPVAVYARVPRPPRVTRVTAALVLASEAFVAGARALLAHGDEHAAADVPVGLRRLRPPRAADVQAAVEAIASELEARRLGEFAASLFAGAAAPERCARVALEQLRSRRPSAGDGGPCFECPVRGVRDVAVWADWLERAHGRPSAALWDLPGRERALFAPGPLPERAPLFWSQPTASYPQLCRIGIDAPEGPAAELADDSLAAVFEQLSR
jgi:type VI secretion system ImpM family protein